MLFMMLQKALPMLFQAVAGTALAGASQSLAGAMQQFGKASDLSSSWTGSAAQAHEQRVARLIDALKRVIQAITQTGTVANTGATQLQALKTRNDAIVASALAAGFRVLPGGMGIVVPGRIHYQMATGPQGPKLMKFFWSIARMYTAQINATVAQASTVDAQIAAILAEVAMQYFADLLQGDSSEATKPSAMSLPDLETTPLKPYSLSAFDTTPTDLSGTALAGAGGLSDVGVASGPAGITPPSGMSTAQSGASTAHFVAGSAGMSGRGMTGMMPMMPLGAGGMHDGEGDGQETWLTEDENPWDSGDDAPDSVLT